MKKIFSSILFGFSLLTLSQPTNYVPGTQVCWSFNGRDHGYFKSASTNGERHILISFTGDGETNCTNYQNQAPQKWLNDAGTNWNGNTTRPDGSVVNWEIFTLPKNADYNIPIYATDIDYFFNAIGITNTNKSNFIHIQGLSGGVGRMWGYMTNQNNHNSIYRNVFSTTISMSGVNLGNTNNVITNYSIGRRHWVWHGAADGNGGTPVVASQTLHDNFLCATCDKRLTIQPGGGHGADTWDVALELPSASSTPQNNRWLWMVDNTNLANNTFTNLSFKIYPIPSKDKINITFDKITNCKVKLYNSLGQEISNSDFNDDEINLDITSAKGLCFIEIETSEGIKAFKKIIVE